VTTIDPGILQNDERMRGADPGGMLSRIKELPSQVREAWALTKTLSLPPALKDVDDVVVLGMGGSAIGGDLAAALLLDQLRVPMTVHRDYGCPAYVDARSLVIASSYSGNTEETLSGFAEARRRGAKLVAVTTGGTLAAEAASAGIPVVRFTYDAQPRAALGWSLTLVLGVLSRIGLAPDLSTEIDAALDELEAYARHFEPGHEDRAKALARSFHGRIVGVFGAGAMGVMARRWKGQWNENAKNWAFFDVLPELDHNAVVGFPHPRSAREILSVLMLRSGRDRDRNALRFEITAELLRRAQIPVEQIRFDGASLLSEALQAVYLGDHVTYYLALLNGADPTPVESIAYLKERLAAGR
jgi:glucose/mannose-6-phosphate isomerase